MRTNLIKWVCVSNSNGSECWLGTLKNFDETEWMHVQGEDCDCAEGECYCEYFGNYLISIYELPVHLTTELKNYHSHSSHFLSKFGEELCLGDFV